jgi:uncharacterized membrane protein
MNEYLLLTNASLISHSFNLSIAAVSLSRVAVIDVFMFTCVVMNEVMSDRSSSVRDEEDELLVLADGSL